jgi:prepilin-type N-terminal cleavage/methylation domain-containing protein
MRNPVIRAESQSDSGYTLIEVMIAMAILGIGLLSIAVAQLSAMKVSSRSKNLQQAMFLAREQLDDLEALPPGAPVLNTAAVIADPANPIQIGNDPTDETRFSRQTTVTVNDPSANLARVKVVVTWNTTNVTGMNQVQLTAVKRMN